MVANFQLPIDLAVRPFHNIKDAFWAANTEYIVVRCYLRGNVAFVLSHICSVKSILCSSWLCNLMWYAVDCDFWWLSSNTVVTGPTLWQPGRILPSSSHVVSSKLMVKADMFYTPVQMSPCKKSCLRMQPATDCEPFTWRVHNRIWS